MENVKKPSGEMILSFDAGTQSIRAALIDASGNIAQIVKRRIEPYFSPEPGWAEQHADYYWKMFCEACRELLDKSDKSSREAIVAVTLTTQRATMINLGEDGRPLRPACLWLDQRKANAEEIVPSFAKPLLKSIGLWDRLNNAVQSCPSNWIQQHQPEIWRQTHKYLLLSGFFTFMLTGEYADSAACNVGYLPFDNKTYQWAGRFDLKWRLFPIEKEKLPRLVKPCEVLGRITARAGEETGIPAGLPVIAAGTDKGCEMLGAGCLTPDTGCLSFGTTATFNTTTTKYIELLSMIPPYPASVPDTYYTEVMIYRGFWMVSWFRDEFGMLERKIAEKNNIAPEKLFDQLIEKVPPGSMGLILQPYWSPGTNTDPYAKGSIIGFGDVHNRAYLYRAILEGLVYGLREGAELTQKRTGTAVSRLRVSGGGSQSDMAMRIAADIFGLPAERPHTYETSALGAAIDAAVGLGLYPDFPSAVKAMTRVKEVFEPVAENHRIYDRLYREVYLAMYGRLRPLMEKIQDITGYPSPSRQ
ncbi:MAG: FGGY-family carbohydrate kinase [Smithellaceae bacterium]|jgi:sugar (pentulose or hexulose) kinase|nr:FGGY-family carbohydrate kinase [Smithellaceae bacterium]MDD3258727.1 FGGY-family carbohydrate kinase [Smithellaceae bacterium]MDD3849802.1 FGGY-family carbohydrate kinase [Smithellaceae bacterium]HOG11466.1 FGGY-family carbohydrate kinase [Smithellaceae bacterium]HOQ71128.1 FGGY-family carbohydrate kinase [Smithellaceae bacterium]